MHIMTEVGSRQGKLPSRRCKVNLSSADPIRLRLENVRPDGKGRKCRKNECDAETPMCRMPMPSSSKNLDVYRVVVPLVCVTP